MIDTTVVDIDITEDDLGQFAPGRPAFVALGEVMVRDTPADMERPERTRLVYLSMAGSEYSVAIGLSRLGIPSAYVSRVPDSAYGWAVRNIAREHGVITDFLVWAPATEPIGRYIYELGRTPRPGVGTYQRMFSAASRLDAGMVDWASALHHARLFHTSGITFGLAAHSRYDRNGCREAFREAVACKPADCLVGLDFNYRSTLWPGGVAQARDILDPILADDVDILITSIHDMARFYGIGCGQYSVEQVLADDVGPLEDDDILAFAHQVRSRFGVQVVAITRRYPDSMEHNRWESAAVGRDGALSRSPVIRGMTLLDTLGGGDAWLAGLYYGLLTRGLDQEGLAAGITVGDAATRLQQTLMFDLPMIDRAELQALLQLERAGGSARTVRR
jgi:2-dehydro-3-deoxygluconokinase